MHVFRARFALVFAILMSMTLGASFPVTLAQEEATPEATPTNEASREVLNTGLPDVAPGFELTMTRVVIPAGSVVSAHFHPGMQLISIKSGTVHYTVVSGELPYTTAGEGGAAGVDGTLGPGESMDFGAGDRFTELPGMVHIAENRGDEPVIVLSASLFQTELPTSIPVETE